MKPIIITLLYLTFGGDIKLDTFEIQDSCSSWFHSNITTVEKRKKTFIMKPQQRVNSIQLMSIGSPMVYGKDIHFNLPMS